MTWTTTVILPDFQVPYHDKKFVSTLVQFVDEYQPDRLVHIGDFLDAPEPAKWNKGMAMEFAGDLQAGLDEGHKTLAAFREVHDGPFFLKTGNHDERTETYVNRYAPALASLSALKYERLLGTDELDIKVERGIFHLGAGWVAAHGHEGSLRHTAGGTALALAKKVGYSVVCGHTHKVGLINESIGLLGKTTTLTGMEVGHAMTFKDAHYLKTGAANWQQGLGILHVKDGRCHAQAVTAVKGRFIVDGVQYGA